MLYILFLSIMLIVLAARLGKTAEFEKVRIPVDRTIARQKKV